MTDPKGYYKILGLSPTASINDVKKAYRHLAIMVHPDKINNSQGKEKAKELFIKINEAYQVLSNENKKREYDSHGLGHSYDHFFKNHDEIFNYFDNIFRNHMNFAYPHLDNNLKEFVGILNKNSMYKTSRKSTEIKYINGKKQTLIKEVLNDNGLVTEKTIIIDDKGQKKENVNIIDNRKKGDHFKIEEKKRPNF